MEKEAREQRLTYVENEVASLQDERKINLCLKEELPRKKEENTKLVKEKEDLFLSVDQSLKTLHLVISTKGDPSHEKALYSTIYLYIFILSFL